MVAKAQVKGYAITLWVVGRDTPCIMQPLSATAVDGSFPVYGKPGTHKLTVRLRPGMQAMRVPSSIKVNPDSFVRITLVDEQGKELTGVPNDRIVD